MKTTGVLILMIWTKSILIGQTTIANADHCTLTYTEKQWTVIHNETGIHKCKEVVIKNVPPIAQMSIPIDMNITVKGFYTIKKDPSLVIPDDYVIAIEDLLTGQYYDLNSEEAYTFSLNRASKEARFVLDIKKNNLKVNSGSTAALNMKP